MNDKILSINEIKKKVFNLKKNKKKIVLCHGVFDLIHCGHLNHFRSAKKYGDFLVVSVTEDKFVNKGPNKPLFNHNLRMDFLSNLELIDLVVLSSNPSSSDVIKLIKPDFYVKGPDYAKLKNDKTKKILLEKKLVSNYGGRVVYTKDEAYSSTNIINLYSLAGNDHQKNFINSLKNEFGSSYILNKIDDFKDISSLIIGELIFDRYVFGNVIGKSGKEPHLVFEKKNIETQVGGSGAIARHISTFLNKVYLITSYGQESDLKKLLNKNFTKNIIFKNYTPSKNYKSIIKTRYIDTVSNYKMFGAYDISRISYLERINKINDLINKIKKKVDLKIIVDYGHDLISNKVLENLLKLKKFTAVNCQLNSSSEGYHNIAKYSGVDLIIINENELRHELKNYDDDIENLMTQIVKKLNFKNIILTRGISGSILFDRKNFTYCPAFAKKILDKVGAGDAMLAISYLCVFRKLDPKITLFLGSIASAYTVENIGNKKNISYDYLTRSVEFLLK